MMNCSLQIADPSGIGQARRMAKSMASELGFDEQQQGKLAIVVTEIGTNIVKHAKAGELVFRSVVGPNPALDLLALDQGPGIADLDQALRDGFSTGASPGTGLGAIARLASSFDVYSQPARGMVLAVRVSAVQSLPLPSGNLDWGVVSMPKPREEVCGDAFAVIEREDGFVATVVDGLGHGPLAFDAAREAIRIFELSPVGDVGEIVKRAHAALRHTRGAAMAVAAMSRDRNEVSFAGVGNISGSIVNPGESRGMASLGGIVGYELRKVQTFAYRWLDKGLLVLASDGLSTRFSLHDYPGLIQRSPSIIAGVLYRDFNRRTDDVTVLVVRPESAKRPGPPWSQAS
jgi:anti-sigma regulatory factor (Ser/Thr protein kinase)